MLIFLLNCDVLLNLFCAAGFGVEAICVLAIAFAKKNSGAWHTAFVLLCVGVGCSGFAISGLFDVMSYEWYFTYIPYVMSFM